jgi:hypothetical protein
MKDKFPKTPPNKFSRPPSGEIPSADIKDGKSPLSAIIVAGIVLIGVLCFLVFKVLPDGSPVSAPVSVAAPTGTLVTVLADGKAEVEKGNYMVDGYMHYYADDALATHTTADDDLERVKAIVKEVLGSSPEFINNAYTFNNWGGETCIKCGKKFAYTIENGFSVSCPSKEKMVELQTRLEGELGNVDRNFRAQDYPMDKNASIGLAVSDAIEAAKKQVSGRLVSVEVVESLIDPEANLNFAVVKIKATFEI